MRVDYDRVDAVRADSISKFDQYVDENGYPTEDILFSMPVVQLVGYFLKVHSKDPGAAVRKYLREHSISYRKANEVKMLINILK